tara:strand:- start:8469 stop:9626 length:1158 start_codon:yes stop_codon:yes gene_type:complete
LSTADERDDKHSDGTPTPADGRLIAQSADKFIDTYPSFNRLKLPDRKFMLLKQIFIDYKSHTTPWQIQIRRHAVVIARLLVLPSPLTVPKRCSMSRIVTVAATQMACSWDRAANIANAEKLVRQAAAQGAQIILIQELFETPYFCQKPNPDYLQLATSVEANEAIAHFQKIAKELQVVLPISFFELAGRARFNSIVIIDADGSNLGIYRKSHIPDGPGYHEKYYFNPGDTGFKVWNTRYAKIGVGICWDQWFPECARSMALLGAEILFYPTAIGSEPHDKTISSRDHWQRVQQGHAGANLMPLIASNRIGNEAQDGYDITFYGSSFIANQFGEKVEELNETEEGVLVHSFDLDQLEHIRSAWGSFRDRRPNLYGPLKTLDGALES